MTSKLWKVFLWTMELPVPIILLSVFISQLK
jgi:hypothetical protein